MASQPSTTPPKSQHDAPAKTPAPSQPAAASPPAPIVSGKAPTSPAQSTPAQPTSLQSSPSPPPATRPTPVPSKPPPPTTSSADRPAGPSRPPEDTMDSQEDELEEEEDPFWYYFRTFGPLIVHMISVAGTFIFLKVFIKGGDFNLDKRKPASDTFGGPITRWRLLQTDVTTLLSAFLIIVRISLTLWCSVVLFYVTEAVRRSQYAPRFFAITTWFPRPSKLLKGRRPARHSVAVVAIVAFIIPYLVSQFTSPIVTGSITWKPSVTINDGSPLNITIASNSRKWAAYQSDRTVRRSVVADAANIAAKAWVNYTAGESPTYKRVLWRVGQVNLAEGTELANITVPYITITKPSWIGNLSTVPTEQCRSVFLGDLLLNVSMSDNPMLAYPGERNVALIPKVQWAQANTTQPPFSYEPDNGTRYHTPEYEFPESNTFSGPLFAVLYAGYTSVADGGNCTDYVPAGADWFNTTAPDKRYPCFAFASVQVQAGVSTCKGCKIHGEDVISTNETFIANQPTLEPDPLVLEALALVPEVSSAIAQMRPNIPTSPIEEYMQTMITRSYMAAWNALVDHTEPTEFGTLKSSVTVALSSSRGFVDEPRAWIWFALHALVWVAALFLISVHNYGLRQEARPPIRYRDSEFSQNTVDEVKAGVQELGLF